MCPDFILTTALTVVKNGDERESTVIPPKGMVRITKPKERPAPQQEPDRLWIVRHARTALNKGGSSVERVRGWKDVPLDATGRAEARRIGAGFGEIPIHLIMTSDLSRAEATAKEIQRATGAKLVVTPGLRPWNMGDFEGQPYAK